MARGLRLTVAEALKRGIVTPTQATAITRDLKQHALKARQYSGERDPHEILYQRLKAVYCDRVEKEKKDLVPGRRFRADVFFEDARLILEVDGFQFHRSRAAFIEDRKRANLFEIQGYRILRYTAGRIFKDMDGVLAEVAAALAAPATAHCVAGAGGSTEEAHTPRSAR